MNLKIQINKPIDDVQEETLELKKTESPLNKPKKQQKGFALIITKQFLILQNIKLLFSTGMS